MSESETTAPVPATAWVYPTLIHGVVGLTLFVRLLVTGPQHEAVFRSFGLLLPKATESFLSLSAWANEQFYPALSGLLAAWLLDGLVLWMLGGWSRSEGWLWFWIILVLLLITWVAMEVSLQLPLFKLREALSR
jgi:type II secretory pathway component PulF